MPAQPILISALLAVQRERRSGVYVVKADDTRTYLYFDRGKLVFAEQGTLGDTLGRVLVRTGKLTSEQYVAALRSMTQRIIDNEQMRFGEVVVELGFLTSDQVLEALAAQVREKVIHCLMLDRPDWSFEERSDPVARVGRFPMPVEPMVLAAMRRLDPDRIDGILQPARDGCLRLTMDASVISERFGLSGPEQRFLELLDGSRSTRKLLEAGPADSAPAAVLAALIASAYVELPEAKSSSLAAVATVSAEHAVPLGVRDPHAEPPAPPLQHHSAAPPSAHRVSADVAPKHVAGKPQSVAVPTPLRAIPVGLSPHAAPLYAEDAFQSGRAHMRRDTPDRALSYLRRAVELSPEAIEFRLWLRWAEWITEDRDADEQVKARGELWRLATQVVKQQPEVGFGYYVLGHFARAKGDGDRATKLFRRALQLDPDLTDAARQLRIVQVAKDTPAAALATETSSRGGKHGRA